jgi:hypothetical protein
VDSILRYQPNKLILAHNISITRILVKPVMPVCSP